MAVTDAAVTNLKQQILSQNTTDKWSGQGYGSAEANAEAMAKLLADAGITDIKQFGKVDKYEPVEVIGRTFNGNNVQNPREGLYYQQIPEDDGEGGIVWRRQDLTPEEIAQVKTQYGVIDTQTDEVRPVSNVVERDGKMFGVTGQTFGNKVTGEAINRGSGRWERQGGEGLFSGTGEGKGNTAFRAQFAPDGTPIFYTTQGSSSDLGRVMPLIQLGLAATGAGGLLGNALLGAGASQVATGALGNAILGGVTSSLAGGDALKGALLGGAGGALGGYLQGGPIDASNMTATQFNDALESQLIGEMQRSGLTNAQITQFLENASPADISSITSALPVTGASDNLLVNAARTPITSDALINTLSQIPTVAVTAKAPEQVSPDVLNSVTSILGGATTTPPTVEVTAKNPNQSDNSATVPIITSPITTNLPTTPTTTPKTTTTTDTGNILNNLTAGQIANIIAGVGGLLGGSAIISGGGTGGIGGGVGALPTQGVPLNSDDYFQAIQRNYNALLPAVPRDVASPLRDWYNSSYGGGTIPRTQVGISPQPMPVAQPTPSVRPQSIANAGGYSGANSGTGTNIPTTASVKNIQPFKPSLGSFMKTTGASFKDATEILYNNVGANIDARNWNAIMASENPMQAAKDALVEMYSNPEYRAQNTIAVGAKGYKPAQAYITYGQMNNRIGTNYVPTAEETRAIEQFTHTKWSPDFKY